MRSLKKRRQLRASPTLGAQEEQLTGRNSSDGGRREVESVLSWKSRGMQVSRRRQWPPVILRHRVRWRPRSEHCFPNGRWCPWQSGSELLGTKAGLEWAELRIWQGSGHVDYSHLFQSCLLGEKAGMGGSIWRESGTKGRLLSHLQWEILRCVWVPVWINQCLEGLIEGAEVGRGSVACKEPSLRLI